MPYHYPPADFQFALGRDNSDIFLGTLDNKIIASIMVGHDGHFGWIYYVATDPDYRLQGIAKKMIAAAEEWLLSKNVRKLMLLVRETNADVVGFYEKLGFEEIPRTVMYKSLEASS